MTGNWATAVRTVREKASLSQKRLARIAELDQSYICIIESGKRQPSIRSLEKIATACNTSMVNLVSAAYGES
jgi:transcriptional regulator with XRE-family HTH domain